MFRVWRVIILPMEAKCFDPAQWRSKVGAMGAVRSGRHFYGAANLRSAPGGRHPSYAICPVACIFVEFHVILIIISLLHIDIISTHSVIDITFVDLKKIGHRNIKAVELWR